MRAGAYDGVEAFAVVGAGSAARCRDGRPSTSRAATLNALSAVSISLDRRTLTQDMIETARQAVALMLDQFPACALRAGLGETHQRAPKASGGHALTAASRRKSVPGQARTEIDYSAAPSFACGRRRTRNSPVSIAIIR